jgi:hypothetical protein
MEEAPISSDVHTDTTMAELILQGITASIAGDTETARKCQLALKEKPEGRRNRYTVDIQYLNAWIAASDEEWDNVVRLLGNLGTSGRYPRVAGRLMIRWLRAIAFERLGQWNEAVEAFRLVLTPRELGHAPELFNLGHYFSFAHHRLVLLCSKMGRVDDARQHLEIFERTFTNPDPELAPMLEEARQALAQAESKSSS